MAALISGEDLEKAIPLDAVRMVKETAAQEGLEDARITSVIKNLIGQGYMGDIYFVTVTNGNENKELKLVLKIAFTAKDFREQAAIKYAYKNEYHFYLDVVPAFRQVQIDILGDVIVDTTPKCYNYALGETQEIAVLENLKSVGFEVFDKRQFYDKEHLERLFETYGKFHALSFALKAKNSALFSELKEKFDEVVVKITDDKIFVNAMKCCFEECNELFASNPDVKEKLCKYAESMDVFFGSLAYDGEHPVFCHGDCWSSNFLFKYDANMKLVEVKMVDFQNMRVRSPVHDLSYCFYSGGSADDFTELDYYLKVYRTTLCSVLETFNFPDTDKIYPLETIKKEWKQYSRYGYAMGIILLKSKLAIPGKEMPLHQYVQEVGNDVRAFEQNKYDKTEYEKRSMDLTRHMFDCGFL